MPASYRIDAAAGVVFVTFQGRVTDQDMLEGQRQLAGDPAFRPTMHQCVDTRDVTDLSITAAGVRELAKGSIFAPGSRRAIIGGARPSTVTAACSRSCATPAAKSSSSSRRSRMRTAGSGWSST